MKTIPYIDITKINIRPKKIFVLIFAKISSPEESFIAKICVIPTTITRKIPNNSIENNPNDEDIIKNQKVNPAVTANALILGEEKFILNRINERY